MPNIWDASQHQPAWWLLVLLGAIAGTLLPLAPTVIRFLSRVRHKSAIEGNWYSYHFTFLKGQATTVESQVRVSKGFRHTYVAALGQNVDSKLEYKGYITREKDQLLFIYKSIDHSETVVNRFQDPLGSNSNRLYGLWLSYDHSQTIACGAIILSRDEIAEDQRMQEIAKGYEQHAARPLVRTKPLLMRVKRL